MAVYAIGDVQGCFDPLMCLLEKIKFDGTEDTLWFAGDLVNRGPRSLDVLRFIKNLGTRGIVVLGNHDLHLLATVFASRKLKPHDTFHDIINAPDKDELIHWLRHQPLIHYDKSLNCAMVHAGIPPIWSLKEAISLGGEVEKVLHSNNYIDYFQAMYGNMPMTWHNDITGVERLRIITNYFTRMRFCKIDGTLDLDSKSGPNSAPTGFAPWFEYQNPALKNTDIVFGHWAALEGQCSVNNIYALDTGCAWGGSLTALRLSDKRTFSCDCR